MAFVKISDKSQIECNVFIKGTLSSLGCHAAVLNNINLPDFSFPKKGGYGHSSWATIRGTSWLRFPTGMTYERYLEEIQSVKEFKDLPEESQRLVVEEYISTTLNRADNWHQTIIFAPVVNYDLPSRGDNRNSNTDTAEVIKLLMKYGKGGSWYGLPLMVNPVAAHRPEYGMGISLFQIVVWNRTTADFPMLRGSRFEMHPEKFGQYGNLLNLDAFLDRYKAPPGAEEKDLHAQFKLFAEEEVKPY